MAPPNVNPSGGREKDLDPGPLDYKSSILATTAMPRSFRVFNKFVAIGHSDYFACSATYLSQFNHELTVSLQLTNLDMETGRLSNSVLPLGHQSVCSP